MKGGGDLGRHHTVVRDELESVGVGRVFGLNEDGAHAAGRKAQNPLRRRSLLRTGSRASRQNRKSAARRWRRCRRRVCAQRPSPPRHSSDLGRPGQRARQGPRRRGRSHHMFLWRIQQIWNRSRYFVYVRVRPRNKKKGNEDVTSEMLLGKWIG